MSAERVHVSRWKVGLIAFGLFAGVVVLWIGWPELQTARAACLRVGLLMAAIWFAMPSGDRPAAWANLSRTTLFVFVLLLAVAVKPKLLLPLAPLLGLIALLAYLGRFAEKDRPSTRYGDRKR